MSEYKALSLFIKKLPMYQCELCPLTFSFISGLDSHLRRMHGSHILDLQADK